jgi:hypothetical protein
MIKTRLSFLASASLLALAAAPMHAAAQAPALQAASAPAAGPMATRSPTDWIEYDDTTVTPVLDDVSRQLAAARAALAAKDHEKAAVAMQSAARALSAQAERAAAIERQRAAADMKLARETREHMTMLVRKLDATAAQLKAGKVASTAALDRTLDKAARADLERRWLVTDVATWYPVSEEPQRHLGAAVEDYARKDFHAAAAELRKASAYLRLETARSTGDARAGLVDAGAAVDRSARALEQGTLKDAQALEQVVVRADHALAVAHRAHAAEAWSHKAYDSAGYELKAAAHAVQGAATWCEDKIKSAASAAATGARDIGDKLASGGVWARDEVAKGFDGLGHALDDIGHAIGVKHKAAPFDVAH